jgi:glycerate-2-kinase
LRNGLSFSHIKNAEKIIQNGSNDESRSSRRLILESVEAAIDAVLPKQLILSKLTFRDSELRLGGTIIKLNKDSKINVVGAGKACGGMAEGLEELLDDHLNEGVVNIPHEEIDRYRCRKIRLMGAGHPNPTKEGVAGVQRMLDLVEGTLQNDLLIVLLSGGASSLMPAPVDGVTLEEKAWLSSRLMKAGATIAQLNSVRKHLSKVKGGKLAQFSKSSYTVGIVISDVVGDRLDVIGSGPTAPDSSTYGDAVEVIQRFGLWDDTPNSIKLHLSKGTDGLIEETMKPQDHLNMRVFNLILANNETACAAARSYLQSRHIASTHLTSYLEGEARVMGPIAASFLKEAETHGQRRAFIFGGETTVTVKGKGIGGRSHEFLMSAAPKLQHLRSIMLSMGTDGIDGTCPAAGAIVNGLTYLRGKNDFADMMRQNDSFTYFNSLGDSIFTGRTGTNVGDICIGLVPKE